MEVTGVSSHLGWNPRDKTVTFRQRRMDNLSSLFCQQVTHSLLLLFLVFRFFSFSKQHRLQLIGKNLSLNKCLVIWLSVSSSSSWYSIFFKKIAS